MQKSGNPVQVEQQNCPAGRNPGSSIQAGRGRHMSTVIQQKRQERRRSICRQTQAAGTAPTIDPAIYAGRKIWQQHQAGENAVIQAENGRPGRKSRQADPV